MQFYRGLFGIRRAWPELSALADPAQPQPMLLALPGWLVGFVPERTDESGPRPPGRVLQSRKRAPHRGAPAGNWRTVCDGVTASPQPFGPVRSGQIELPPVGAVILAAQAAPGG